MQNLKTCTAIFFIIFIVLLLAKTAFAMDVTLSWDNNEDAAYYKVYYGIGPGDYSNETDKIDSNTHTVTGLENRQYFFAVRAFNDCGNASDFSDEVTNAIPGKVSSVVIQTCITYEQ